MDFDIEKNETVDDINKVPEQFRSLYTEGEDGGYQIADANRGVATALAGLGKSLKAARKEAKEAKGKSSVDLSPLQQLELGNDPAEIAENVKAKLDELQQQAAGSKDAKQQIDKVREEMNKAKAESEKAAQAKIDALQNQLYDLLVKNNATTAIVDQKGDPDLLMPFIRDQIKVAENDGKFTVEVIDSQGDRRYSGVTGEPMTIKELIAEMKNNPKYGRLFESEAPTGGGTQPQQTRTPPQQSSRDLSPTEKISRGLQNRSRTRGASTPQGMRN